MGVYVRSDSPYYWLWLENAPPGQEREKTKIAVGRTQAARSTSRQLAEDLYHRRMNELAAQVHNLPRAKPTITFDAYATWYETHVAKHHRGYLREREMLQTLRATFGAYGLREISAAAVREWRSARLETKKPATVNRELDVLKSMLKAAIPRYLEESPIAGLPRVRVPRRETKVLTRDEERRLLLVLAPADRALIICALDTLMRLSDILNLRREQDRGSYLVVEDPKVTPYRVPVSTRLRQALDGLPKRGAYYFAHRRTATRPDQWRSIIKNMLQRACEAAEPPIPYGRPDGLTFHALRHTGATRLMEAGVSIRVIQEIGGWQSTRQLDRYAHPSEAAKVQAVELIGPPAQKRPRSRRTPVKAKARTKSAKKRR